MKTRSQTERLLLLTRKILPDRQGGYQEDWEELGSYWASLQKVQHPFSRTLLEGVKAGSLPPRNSLYKIKACLGLPTNFERFQWQNRLFAVVSFFETEQRKGEVSFYAASLEDAEQEMYQNPLDQEDSNV